MKKYQNCHNIISMIEVLNLFNIVYADKHSELCTETTNISGDKLND